jgi:hypothetical protein
MRISGFLAAYFAISMLGMAGLARAEGPDAPAMAVAGVFLDDARAAAERGWDVLIPAHAIMPSDTAQTMIVSAYVRNDAKGLQSILLVQRNLLPTSLGWGQPSGCASHAGTVVAVAYRSARDMLCGWARPVAFGAPASDARLAPPVQHALQLRGALPADIAQPEQPPPRLVGTWLAWSASWLGRQTEAEAEPTDTTPQFISAGWRISDRHDVLDLQLLVRGDAAPSQMRLPILLARATHALGETGHHGQPTESAFPDSAPSRRATAAASLFDGGGATQATAKSFFARTVMSMEAWVIAGIALGSSAAGVTMAAVLDTYASAVSWANDYVWDRVSPLRPETQDFVQLVASS